MKKNKLMFASKFVLGLSLLTGTALLASSTDHDGDHMHMGQMKNHMNKNEMTNKMMKKMASMKMSNGKMSHMNKKAYQHKMRTGSYEVLLSSKKALKDGKNEMMISIMKNGSFVNTADVKIRFDMPSMPGMDFTNKATKMKSSYKTKINFSMGGVWDYEIMIKSSDGKMHKTKGSVKL